MLQWYYKEYHGPTWLYAIDLGTGHVKKQRFPDNVQIHMSGQALGFDGKYYIASPLGYSSKSQGMAMFVYDPATNTLENRGVIVPGLMGEVRPIVIGPDERIYGTGSWDGGKVGLYIYDPKLGKMVKDFGPLGPSHPNGVWSRAIGVDDTHAYIVSGDIPFYLVSVNLATGEQKVLLESPSGHRIDVDPTFPGALATVPQEGGASQKEYWLYHGQAILKVDNKRPWPAQASPWDKAPKTKPEIYRDQFDPDAGGNATLWYRLPEDAAKAPPAPPARTAPPADAKPEDLGWRAICLEGIDTYSYPIARLALLPDGRLYGTAADYVGSFIFDPKSAKATLLGRNLWVSPYTYIAYGDKLYTSGYWEGAVFAFDPKRPWTMHKGGPPGHPAPEPEDPASNPRRVGRLDKAARMTIGHSAAVGADGKIYIGGFGLRGYTGGSFGWYDPKTGKVGGFWRPLSGCEVRWLAPLKEGRLIAMSTSAAPDELNGNRTPEEARLFVYDVTQARIVREIVPVPKAATTGLVIDVAPDRLLGLTLDPERPKAAILYGVDITTGDVLFRKTLPWPVSENRWYRRRDKTPDFVPSPDGFVRAFLKNALVRINPKDASVHVAGRIDVPGSPTFVGNDVYFTGTHHLRRIRNIVPAP